MLIQFVQMEFKWQYRFFPIAITWSNVAESCLWRDMTSLGQNDLLLAYFDTLLEELLILALQYWMCGLYVHGFP